MKRYQYLLWDIDGTILNFKESEKAAIKALFKKYNFGECTDEMVSRYSDINVKYWQALERNEMTKPDILVERFREFFRLEGIEVDKAVPFNSDYQIALGDTVVFCENAFDILKKQKALGYTLIAVTNGTEIAQSKKLKLSGLDNIFDYIYISELVGAEKPNKAFFDYVFSETGINDDNIRSVLIIGDSLTSDIKGGNNSGIDTCWYNKDKQSNYLDIDITYEVDSLSQIMDIIM